ncbi:MAG: hypothetical protein H7641_02405 [Candidatus Heimdallarchaeota archaeon]|nr:hypothetical protein [Candidatus Heimdallarchaeota archaeon]MCK4876416.1 hypothetical protein [Candidatus Heimdallarchaeota archaeon]
MAPIFIPSIFSVFITIGFFALLFGFLSWGVRKLNKNVTDRRLRRKLSAASMSRRSE